MNKEAKPRIVLTPEFAKYLELESVIKEIQNQPEVEDE